MQIYLIRHTKVETDISVCYGQTDVGLADTYMDEFNVIKSKIENLNELKFYSSPLKRCQMLANFLSEGNYTTDNRLKEINLGDWEMKTWEFVQENLFLNWTGDYANVTSPNGESFKDLYDRSSSFYDEVTTNKDQDIAIVAHMGVVRAILAYVLEMPVHKALCIKMEYGGVSKIEILPFKTNVLFFNR